MVGLKETLDKMAKANGVKWYGHVVRRDDESILKKAMMFEANRPRKRGRPKQTWKKQVEENIKKIGWRKLQIARDGEREWERLLKE